MFDGALPVLGQLPSARRLELVRRHPRIVKQYTSALAPLTKLIQMQHCLVLAALHLQYCAPLVARKNYAARVLLVLHVDLCIFP